MSSRETGTGPTSWLQQFSAEQEHKYHQEKEAERRRVDAVLNSAWATVRKIDKLTDPLRIKGVL